MNKRQSARGDDCNKVHIPGWKSGMEIRGLGLSLKQDSVSSDCAETVLESSFLGVTASFCEFLVITKKITEMNI